RAELRLALADQIDAPFQPIAVDDDADAVAVAYLADGPAGQRLRPDVADARPGRNAAEARVGHDRDVLAEAQVLQRRRDLVDLLHAAAHRPAADEDQHVARLERVGAVAFDRADRRPLAGEDARRPRFAVHAVGVHHARVDGGALDDRTFRR